MGESARVPTIAERSIPFAAPATSGGREADRPHDALLSPSAAVGIAVAFWTVFGVICGLQVWLSMRAHGHALGRVVLHQVAVWDAWVLFGIGATRLARRVPPLPLRARRLAVHGVAGTVTGTLHAAWWTAMTLAIRPYDAMNPVGFGVPFLETAFYQMPLELLLYFAVVLVAHGERGYREGRHGRLRAAELERSLAAARLQSLELQIQPHFLFNTLNAISGLIRTGQDATALVMLSGLADLFRYALDRGGGERVALETEAEMLSRYLEIQRLRFPDRLSYEVDIGPEARRAGIPVLLLQPLVENAIRHGIAPGSEPGWVQVRARRNGDELHVEISSTGRLGERVTYGVGLTNTVARLAQMYAAGQRFELRQEGDRVVARLVLPWSEVS